MTESDGYYETCIHCNGSGEGQYDGTRCRYCKGRGVEHRPEDDEERACAAEAYADALRDERGMK